MFTLFKNDSRHWKTVTEVVYDLLKDQVLSHSIPKTTLTSFKKFFELNADISIDQFIVRLEKVGIMAFECPDMLDYLEESLLVTRILLVDETANKYKFLYSDRTSFVESIDHDHGGLRVFALIPALENKKISKLKFVLNQFQSLWKKYIVSLIFSIVIALVSVIPTLAMSPIFSSIVPQGHLDQLMVLGVALVLSQVVQSWIQSIQIYYSQLYDNDIALRSYIGYAARYLTARPLSLANKTIASWVQSFKSAIAFSSSIKTIVVNLPTSIFKILLNSMVASYSLSNAGVVELLILFSLIPAISNILISWRVGSKSVSLMQVNASINQQLYRTFAFIGEIRSLDKEPEYAQQFSVLRKNLNDITLNTNSWTEVGILLNATLRTSLIGVILLLYSNSAATTQGGYLVLFSAFASVSTSFTEIAEYVSKILSSLPTYFTPNALRDISEFSAYKTPSYQKTKQKQKLNKIQLKNVDFAYEPEVPIIKNLNLEFVAGNNYVVTGSPGKGKSTLLKLIGGVYLPSSGSIVINGLANSAKTNQLKSFNVCYLPQQSKLLGDKLNDFLDPYGIFSENDLEEVLALTTLDEFLPTLPLGLKTPISEFSMDLSTGQIQLFHIARVLLEKPDLVLSDELTSHLDEELHLRMIQLLNNQNFVHISNLHRLSALKLFSRRYDLDELLPN